MANNAHQLTSQGYISLLGIKSKNIFDSVYLDDDVKVAKDIQGNYLIVDLAPYSWELVLFIRANATRGNQLSELIV
ncbi:putative plastid-lipid-associated protein 11, partial [Quercus suber]